MAARDLLALAALATLFWGCDRPEFDNPCDPASAQSACTPDVAPESDVGDGAVTDAFELHDAAPDPVDGAPPPDGAVDAALVAVDATIDGDTPIVPIDAAIVADVAVAPDADEVDVTVDAAVDAEADAELDAAVDAEADVAVDAEADVAVDAEADVEVDAELDAAVDAELDAAVDAELDVAVDVAVDAEVDVAVDAAVDVAVDAAPDALFPLPDGEVGQSAAPWQLSVAGPTRVAPGAQPVYVARADDPEGAPLDYTWTEVDDAAGVPGWLLANRSQAFWSPPAEAPPGLYALYVRAHDGPPGEPGVSFTEARLVVEVVDCADGDGDGDGISDIFGCADEVLDCAGDTPAISPDLPEVCDGLDQDCDDRVDEDSCPAGDVCGDEGCVCDAHHERCEADAACVDVRFSEAHCGECGNAVRAGQRCLEGQPVTLYCVGDRVTTNPELPCLDQVAIEREFWVSASRGTPEGTGTFADPVDDLAPFLAALDPAGGAALIHVEFGEYVGPVVVPAGFNGLIIRGEPHPANPTVNPRIRVDRQVSSVLLEGQNVQFERFEVLNGQPTGVVVRQCVDCAVVDVTAHGTGGCSGGFTLNNGHGVHATASPGLRVVDSQLSGLGAKPLGCNCITYSSSGYGAYVAASVGARLIGNEFRGVRGAQGHPHCGIGSGDPGAAVGAYLVDSPTAIIEGNTFAEINGGNGNVGDFGAPIGPGYGGQANAVQLVSSTGVRAYGNVIDDVVAGTRVDGRRYVGPLAFFLETGSDVGVVLDRSNRVAGQPVHYYDGQANVVIRGADLSGPLTTTNLGEVVVRNATTVLIEDVQLGEVYGHWAIDLRGRRWWASPAQGLRVEGSDDVVVRRLAVSGLFGGNGPRSRVPLNSFGVRIADGGSARLEDVRVTGVSGLGGNVGVWVTGVPEVHLDGVAVSGVSGSAASTGLLVDDAFAGAGTHVAIDTIGRSGAGVRFQGQFSDWAVGFMTVSGVDGGAGPGVTVETVGARLQVHHSVFSGVGAVLVGADGAAEADAGLATSCYQAEVTTINATASDNLIPLDSAPVNPAGDRTMRLVAGSACIDAAGPEVDCGDEPANVAGVCIPDLGHHSGKVTGRVR